MLDTLTLESFVPCVGSDFACPLSDGTNYVLTLQEAEETGHRAAPGASNARKPFSLIFLAPGEIVLPQDIYPLEHATLGSLPIFIVPIGKDAAGVRYQAIFS